MTKWGPKYILLFCKTYNVPCKLLFLLLPLFPPSFLHTSVVANLFLHAPVRARAWHGKPFQSRQQMSELGYTAFYPFYVRGRIFDNGHIFIHSLKYVQIRTYYFRPRLNRPPLYRLK